MFILLFPLIYSPFDVPDNMPGHHFLRIRNPKQKDMIYKQYVHEALKRSHVFENNGGSHSGHPALDQSSLISRLIHDIFGGEILKTLNGEDWHFYNRVNGENVDFTTSETRNLSRENHLAGIPSTIDETQKYFEQEDYSTFYQRFVRAFEESVNHDKIRSPQLV